MNSYNLSPFIRTPAYSNFFPRSLESSNKWGSTVVVKLPHSEVNESNLSKYKKLVEENYKETLDGKYEDSTKRILQLIDVKFEDEDEHDGDS